MVGGSSSVGACVVISEAVLVRPHETKLSGDDTDHRSPVRIPLLGENSHRGIPVALLPAYAPPPFALKPVEEPRRFAKRAAQVHNSGIDADDQVEVCDEAGSVHK